jgi:hypothetical protein
MAGARLELNGASKSRIIVTELEPVQHHVASIFKEMKRFPEPEPTSSFKDPQVLVSFIILAEIEPKQKAALFRWLQL